MKADDKRMPMLQTEVSRAALRREGRGQRVVRGLPTTFLVTSFYWDNLYMFGMAPKKGDDGKLAWTFPMGTAKMAGIAAEDIGKVAYGIFKAGDAVRRQDRRHHGRGPDDRADGRDASRKVLGVGPVKYNAVEADAYRSFGFPGADEIGNMFQAYRDFDKEMLAVAAWTRLAS